MRRLVGLMKVLLMLVLVLVEAEDPPFPSHPPLAPPVGFSTKKEYLREYEIEFMKECD
jgi:hypothetical protein